MPAFVLDTDTFSLFLKGHSQVCGNVLGRPLDQTTTTIITVEEELGGWYSVLRNIEESLGTGSRVSTNDRHGRGFVALSSAHIHRSGDGPICNASQRASEDRPKRPADCIHRLGESSHIGHSQPRGLRAS